MKHILQTAPAALLALVALTACGEKDKEALGKACPPAPAALTSTPKLPGGFPDAPGITYTGVSQKGPTTVATGYLAQAIGPAHTTYAQAVKGAPGFAVTKEEQDVADAEVNFTGGGTSGQVKLTQTCKDRTTVTITIRPA
jgi:hypothetical protein